MPQINRLPIGITLKILNILVSDAVQRAFIVEAEITRMDYVVGSCLLRQIVQRFQITWRRSTVSLRISRGGDRGYTPDICHTQDPHTTALDNTPTVWKEG